MFRRMVLVSLISVITTLSVVAVVDAKGSKKILLRQGDKVEVQCLFAEKLPPPSGKNPPYTHYPYLQMDLHRIDYKTDTATVRCR